MIAIGGGGREPAAGGWGVEVVLVLEVGIGVVVGVLVGEVVVGVVVVVGEAVVVGTPANNLYV